MLSNFKSLLSIVLLSLFLLTPQKVSALEISNGLIKLDDISKGFNSLTPIELDLTNKGLQISCSLTKDDGSDLDSLPKQISILLSSSGVDSYFYPTIKNYKITLNLPLSKISKLLLITGEPININLLTGDSNKSKNELRKIGELKPSNQLINSVKSKEPTRFQPLDEITHIFKGPSTYANPLICCLFVLVVIVSVSYLILSWFYFDAININNLTKLPIGFTVQFLACIALIEIIFFDYFLQTSIFTTIFRTFVVGLIAVYTGAKVLRGMYKLRQGGLR